MSSCEIEIQAEKDRYPPEIIEQMGYKRELKRQLTLPSMVALGFSVLSCWVAMSSTLQQTMIDGGSASLVWGWLGCCFFIMLVGLCVCDMCSAYPVAGGQYFWCLILTKGTKWGRGISYFCGWVQICSMTSFTAINWYLIGINVLGIAELDADNYKSTRWQLFLVGIGAGLMALIGTIFGSKILPKMSYFALGWSICGLIICFVVVLSCAAEYMPGTYVFTSSFSGYGWRNTGVAVLIGVLQSSYGVAMFDSVARVAEEIKDAPRQVPRAMVIAIFTSFITCFPFLIALMFCISNPEQIFVKASRFPTVEVFYQAIRNKVGASCLCAILLVAQTCTNIGLLTQVSRLVYSFARDGGFPLGLNGFFSHISPTFDTPVHATFLVALGAVGLLSIVAASLSTFYTVVAMSFTGIYGAHLLAIGTSVVRAKYKRPGYYNLGKWALVVKIPAMLYLTICIVFMFFPLMAPTTYKTMNYDCVVLPIVCMIALFGWFGGARRTYFEHCTV